MSDNTAEDEVQDRLSSIYYNFEERVSQPKIAAGFMLPVDGHPVLELVGSLGYDSCKLCNLHVLDPNTLMFAAGSYIRVYHMNTKKNAYLRCTGVGCVNCLAVAPNRYVFASGERGEKPEINIFGYPSLKLRKVLRNGTQKEYVSMMFEPTTGDLLASQGGEPDFSLTIWDWKKEVPLLRSKSFSQDVHKVAFSEELVGCLVTSGVGHIRFWTMAITFTGLKLKGETGRFGVHDMTNIEAFVQFSNGKVLSSSEEGTMLLWEEGLLKAEFTRVGETDCHHGKITEMFLYEGEILTLGEDGYVRTWHMDDIIFVEPDFHGEVFRLHPMLEIRVGEQSSLMHMVEVDTKNPDCFDWYAQDKEGRIWTVDMSIALTAPPPKLQLHYPGGPILACAASHLTHLVATASHDGIVRIFDCLQQSEVLSMTFKAPASSVAWMPPSVDMGGASIVAGFDDGVVRKLVFYREEKPKSTEKQINLEGKLSQAFKAHRGRVVSVVFSPKGDMLTTGSKDNTIFIFRMDDTKFEPIGWLSMPASVVQLVWTPFHFKLQGLLAVCEEGIVVQLQLRNTMCNAEQSDKYEFLNPKLQLYKFQSIKSEIQRAEQLGTLKEEIIRTRKKKAEMEKQSDESSSGTEEEEEPVLEEEENWQPFYPDSPSPILQALYSEKDNYFWLTLGGYDAGYVYLCRFPDIYYDGEDISKFVTRPEKAVAVPDCSDIPITVMKINQTSWQTLVLMGFQNGHVRIVQLPQTVELDDISNYWDLNVHDEKNGSLTGMEFAFDRCYLVTTGMDGNIFIFSYTGLLQMSGKTISTVPLTIRHHEICSEDIPSDALCFAEDIEHKKQENVRREAEASKKQRRWALKELQKQLTSLLLQNDQLPYRQRLACQELLVNPDLYKEHNERQKEKINEVHKIHAWQMEKTRLLLEKAKCGFLKYEDLEDQFTVKAFSQLIQVKSYRVPRDPQCFEEFLAATTPEEREIHSPKESGEYFEDSQDAFAHESDSTWQLAYSMTQRRSIGLTGTVARSLKMALDKASKAKRKRLTRNMEWQKLLEEKVLVDKDNPEDLQAIEDAKQTVGYIKLKTDPLYAVERSPNYSNELACEVLAHLDRTCYVHMTAFNKKLRKLREEKSVVVNVFSALNTYLCQISGGTKSLPDPPQLSQEEVPETKLVSDEQTLYTFKHDFQVCLNAASDSPPYLQPGGKEEKPLYSHLYYKGERSDMSEILKFVLKQNILKNGSETPVDTSSSEETYFCDDEQTSTLQDEMYTFYCLRIDFEESLIKKFMRGLMAEFDEKLRDLYIERFELDVLLKLADSSYISKLEEFLQDIETTAEEQELIQETKKMKQDIKKNQTASIQIRKQMTKKNEESEQNSKALSDLWFQFQNVCADKSGTKMMRFLTHLYKRRVSKKKSTDEDEDEDMSVSESFSLSSDSDSSASMSMDLDYCPEELEPHLYNVVEELQKQRQELDDRQSELKEEQAVLNKELEQNAKEAESLRRTNEKIEQRVQAFYGNKMNMINEIITVVPLLESRIYCEFSKGLVMNIADLRRLYSRVGEQKKEIKAQVLIKKSHVSKHLALRRANRLLSERIDTWNRKCDDEILKKFGKPVSVQNLELITMNLKGEMLRCQLVMDKDKQVLEQKALDKEIRGMQNTLRNKQETTTTYYHAQANMIREKTRLEHCLELDRKKDNVLEDASRQRMLWKREEQKFVHLLNQQATVMRGCWAEINGLMSHGTSRAHRLPPITMYTKHRMTATRNIRPEVRIPRKPKRQ